MTILLELDYDEATELRDYLANGPCAYSVTEALTSAIENEDERRYEQRQESLMESGGGEPESYRREMKDAGRGHLLR